MTSPIFDAADRFVTSLADLDPISAIQLGLESEGLGDFSPAGAQAQSDLIRKTLAEVHGLESTGYRDDIARSVLQERLAVWLEGIEARDYEADINILGCPLQSIRMAFDLLPFESDADKQAFVHRASFIPGALAGWRESLSAGLKAGNLASRRQALEVAQQCFAFGNGSFLSTMFEGLDGSSLQVAAEAESAFNAMGEWLRDTYAPATTEVDGIGRDQDLNRITDRMHAAAKRYDPNATLAEVMEKLDSDPRYIKNGEEELLEYLRDLTARTTAEMNGVHFDIPVEIQTCDVKLAGAGSAAAPYYIPPSEDLSRPGSTWYPTRGRTSFPIWGDVSTWYHEAIPGHHLQIGTVTINRDNLSRFQRTFGWTSGHGEGWALYAERLMDELGYFDEPALELGYLSNQGMRAARIIVDIGMHCGMTVPATETGETPGAAIDYDFAVEFLQRRALQTADFAQSEVVRYLGLPAQAISYKLGERVIMQCRDRAKAKFGADFDLKAWHAALLDLGPVGLDLLAAEMDRF